MSISLILPSYNEAKSLELLLPEIINSLNKLNEKYEIIVVDTVEPTDDTEQVCKFNNVTYLRRTGGNLYGDAIRTGIKKAACDYIAVMDADGSHKAEDLLKLCKVTPGSDIVIGSRYIDGGQTENGAILKLMSFVLNLSFRILFGLKVKDTSNSFRIYDAEKLKSLHLECNNFDIVEEILIRLKTKYVDIKIKEVPVHFNKRTAGKSKRDLSSFIPSYVRTIYMLKKYKKQEERGVN